MEAGLANGHLWLFRDVFVGRCDADVFGDARRIDVHYAGFRPKVLRRLIVERVEGGRALIVLFRQATPAKEVLEIEIREAGGRALARLPRQDTRQPLVLSLDALLNGLREADALGVLRSILATSRATICERDGASLTSTVAQMLDFLTQAPGDDVPLPVGRDAHRAAAVRSSDVAARAALQNSALRDRETEVHVLRTETSLLLDDDLLLFTGRAPWPLSRLAETWIGGDDQQRPVPVRCLSLDYQADEAGVAFIGIVRWPGLVSSAPGQLTVAIDGRRLRLLLGAPRRSQGDGALDSLRTGNPQALPKIADFMVAVLTRTGPSAGCGPAVQMLLRDLLLDAGQSSGVIEIVGVLSSYGLLVQGWSRHPLGTRHHVVTEADHCCRRRRALFATFARDDLSRDGTGFIGLIEAPDASEAGDLQRIHLRKSACWWHLDWLPDGQRLRPEVTHDHVRNMLPQLQADPTTLRTFRRIANGGFNGRDTLSSLDRPVRMGFDFAMIAAGAGLFLAGWLLDPTRIIDCLYLRSTGGTRVDLTQHWTRIARADLNEAFGSDPLFRTHLSAEIVRHGFMAFVPRVAAPTATEEFYIEAVLTDDSVHFLPITFARRVEAGAVRRLLASFDRNDPAASQLIERHIGPFVAATGRPPQLEPDQVTVLEALKPVYWALRSVIVPLGASARDFDVNLASFAVDPDFVDTQLVVVAPAMLGGPVISALWHQASFYGLHVRLVVTQEALDPCAALEVGAGHATSDTLVFLSAATFPRQRGWLERLCRCFGSLDRPALISPTLLYEDDSIKFAGLHKRGAPMLQPAEAITSTFAGYPRDWLKSKALDPVLAATTECCVLSRGTLHRLDGFSHDLIAPELKSADFMLRARIAGIPSFWLPSVEMVALDERFDDDGAYWFQNRLVIDEWRFGRKWASYLAETREAA